MSIVNFQIWQKSVNCGETAVSFACDSAASQTKSVKSIRVSTRISDIAALGMAALAAFSLPIYRLLLIWLAMFDSLDDADGCWLAVDRRGLTVSRNCEHLAATIVDYCGPLPCSAQHDLLTSSTAPKPPPAWTSVDVFTVLNVTGHGDVIGNWLSQTPARQIAAINAIGGPASDIQLWHCALTKSL